MASASPGRGSAERAHFTDGKALAKVLGKHVTGQLWLNYGTHPGTDRFTEDCQEEI